MNKYTGKSVFGGIAIGKIMVYEKGEHQVKRVKITDAEAEKNRYYEAVEIAFKQLGELHDKALREVGEANAAIFEIHQMMLEDDDYKESVEHIIESQMVNAEYAIAQTGDNFSQMFAAMDDEYMRGRAADVKDITERLLGILSGNTGSGVDVDEPVIMVAEDLAPSETVQMDKSKILSFVTQKGSVNSHTAILARTMGIPALIGSDIVIDESLNGKLGVVDGTNGVVYIEPDEATLSAMQEEQRKDNEKKALLQELKGKEDVTLDGKKIKLYSNIGNIKDLANVIANDAAGIGLFRSEFIYLESDTFPTEEEQFNIYRTVAESMAGKPVIIRTLDIGADKQCDYFGLDKEDNPALGLRAIRICLTRPEIFKTQLRALFRASVYGNLGIMFPMITSVSEVEKALAMCGEVKAELKEQGITVSDSVELGIMIETPAAVMTSDIIAKEVDFFNIGTNDLEQFAFGLDRQNPCYDRVSPKNHRALLRMIKMVCDNAHANGIKAGICGEIAGDPTLTEIFLELDVDMLSVVPSRVLPLRKAVRSISLKDPKKAENDLKLFL